MTDMSQEEIEPTTTAGRGRHAGRSRQQVTAARARRPAGALTSARGGRTKTKGAARKAGSRAVSARGKSATTGARARQGGLAAGSAKGKAALSGRRAGTRRARGSRAALS
jgi:hypothetical protein